MCFIYVRVVTLRAAQKCPRGLHAAHGP